MKYRIEFSVDSQREFERLKVFKRRRVFDAVQSALEIRLRRTSFTYRRSGSCVSMTSEFFMR